MTGRKSREQEIQAMRRRLEQCVSQFDIFRLLREITGISGFKYFLVTNTAGPADGLFSEAVIITSAPTDLFQAYGTIGSMTVHPLAAMIRGTGAPFEYRLHETDSAQPDSPPAVSDVVPAQPDLDYWFIIPVYHPDHGPAAVCFLGDRPPMSSCETAEMTLLGHLIHHKLRRVSAEPVKTASPLTERERECLLWTAAGKTSVEIGRILDLSEHTVNHYLNNVAKKIGAVNRTQAVAFAMRHGFIE
ncbi:MAG: LuxR C-terminal-related transcriptional regulator [Hoeflea sp.]|uniref:helix-turn-helix transcriptional regulator n=1 Tax=Hoeflea sp. TaxID=1940281 RepID=UPI0032982AFE|tara:strand:- start:5289 stop:6023 length:735 start_codon:yes stop_codon:yes gene_type:complete